MRRREFVTGVLAAGLAADALGAQGQGHGAHDEHAPVDGPLANATVSFGGWPSEPPFDRLNPLPPGPAPNVHKLIPHTVTIKAGGNVNFIVAGFHNIVVYGPGTTPETIGAHLTIPVPGAPPNFPLLIDDPVNRVYRGLNPFTQPQDRVEVVNFANTGTHLVICAFVPHFMDRMFGWVKVV